MKKLLLLITFLSISFFIHASHIVGGEIGLKHVTGNTYLLELSLYRDISGIRANVIQTIDVYSRNQLDTIARFYLQRDTVMFKPHITLDCNPPNHYFEYHYYSDTVYLDPNTYNDPGGYYLIWQSCCRNSGISNIDPSSNSSTLLTLIPPVELNGSPNINSTPDLNTPVTDFAYQAYPYWVNFGGTDRDGDSLAYEFYTPWDQNFPIPGNTSPETLPHKDPRTQFTSINWAPGFSLNNPIHGFGGSHNTLKIDSLTGDVTMMPGYRSMNVYGIWCKEYRNGQLIGSVFRDLQLYVDWYPYNIWNYEPHFLDVQTPSNAQLHADTIVFSSSPVCLSLSVIDSNLQSEVSLLANHQLYDTSDFTFSPGKGFITDTDTFQSMLCLSPDTFFPHTSMIEVIVKNPGCYVLNTDTLRIHLKYIGYSNAGYGGDKTIPMTSFTGSIPLFPMLSRNPYTGGTWYDLDGNNHMNPNGFLEWKYITQPKTYRMIYVQKEPNYPHDTAFLTLNFVYPSSIEETLDREVLIYPNPSNGAFTLEVPDHLIGEKIEVYSYELRKVSEFRIEQNRDKYSIDQEGLYFLKVGEGREIRKLIIKN